MNRTLWPLLASYGIWAVAFVVIYAVQALGCAWAWPPIEHRVALLAIYLGTLIILALLLIKQVRDARHQEPIPRLQRATIIATASAIAASAITFAPTLFASACI